MTPLSQRFTWLSSVLMVAKRICSLLSITQFEASPSEALTGNCKQCSLPISGAVARADSFSRPNSHKSTMPKRSLVQLSTHGIDNCQRLLELLTNLAAQLEVLLQTLIRLLAKQRNSHTPKLQLVSTCDSHMPHNALFCRSNYTQMCVVGPTTRIPQLLAALCDTLARSKEASTSSPP